MENDMNTATATAEIETTVRELAAVAEGTRRILHDLAAATDADARFDALEALVALMRDDLIDIHVAITEPGE